MLHSTSSSTRTARRLWSGERERHALGRSFFRLAASPSVVHGVVLIGVVVAAQRLLQRVEQSGAPGEGPVAALDVEELADEFEMQPVVAAQLSEFGDLGRSDGEVVIERAARELGAGDLA